MPARGYETQCRIACAALVADVAKPTNQAASSGRAFCLTGSYDEFKFGRELLHEGKLLPVGEGLTMTQYSTADLHALSDSDLDDDKQLDSAMQRVSGVLTRNLDGNLSSAAIGDDAEAAL